MWGFRPPAPCRTGGDSAPRRTIRPPTTWRSRSASSPCCRSWAIFLVNLTAGSPYYNPHIQRPALFPPSDGYLPPEDPLVGVARQIDVVRQFKARFPGLIMVGSGYSYLQEWLPHVAGAVVGGGWADSVGLGRMTLSYPYPAG